MNVVLNTGHLHVDAVFKSWLSSVKQFCKGFDRWMMMDIQRI